MIALPVISHKPQKVVVTDCDARGKFTVSPFPDIQIFHTICEDVSTP